MHLSKLYISDPGKEMGITIIENGMMHSYRTGNFFFTNPAKLLCKGTMELTLTPELKKCAHFLFILVNLGGVTPLFCYTDRWEFCPIVLSCFPSICNIIRHLFMFICQWDYFLLISLSAALTLSLKSLQLTHLLHNFLLFVAPSL